MRVCVSKLHPVKPTGCECFKREMISLGRKRLLDGRVAYIFNFYVSVLLFLTVFQIPFIRLWINCTAHIFNDL